MPGSATWESASPTSAMRFKIINAPMPPDAMPTVKAMTIDESAGKSTGLTMRFFLMFVEAAFAEKSREILRVQHFVRFSVADHLPVQT